jgi:hypothetical protein
MSLGCQINRELKIVATEKGLELNVIELKTPEEAQNAPSVYATLNLIHDGKLLADHYVSQRRFLDILKKEVK